MAMKKKPFTIVTSTGEKHVFHHKRSMRRAFKRWLAAKVADIRARFRGFRA